MGRTGFLSRNLLLQEKSTCISIGAWQLPYSNEEKFRFAMV